jgi:hypothetical protein
MPSHRVFGRFLDPFFVRPGGDNFCLFDGFFACSLLYCELFCCFSIRHTLFCCDRQSPVDLLIIEVCSLDTQNCGFHRSLRIVDRLLRSPGRTFHMWATASRAGRSCIPTLCRFMTVSLTFEAAERLRDIHVDLELIQAHVYHFWQLGFERGCDSACRPLHPCYRLLDTVCLSRTHIRHDLFGGHKRRDPFDNSPE